MLAVLLCAAVVVQLTVVNRLPLPGGAAPDLVLLLVTAIAVCTSPLAGALAGFAGGLALDVAPPSIHYAGEYALVFCLAGWGAARVNRAITDVRGERDQVVTFAVMAGAAAAGEAGKAALGMMLSDPDVTAAVASRLLPTAVLYDLLVAPFAFWLVARVTRGADAERAPAPEFSVEQRLALVFRSASAGAAAGLRLAGTGENYFRPPAAGRVPRLRLSSGHAGSSIRSGCGRTRRRRSPPRRTGAQAQLRRGPARPNRAAARAAAGPWQGLAARRDGGRARWLPPLKAQAAAAARRTAHRPGRGWLGGGPGRPVAARRAGAAGLAGPPVKRGPRTPGKGWITAVGSALPAGARRAPAGLDHVGGSPAASLRRVSRLPGKGWITAGRLAGLAARRAARGPAGAGSRRAPRRRRPGGPGPSTVRGGRPRRTVGPSGLSALSGGGTPMAARGFRGGRAIRGSLRPLRRRRPGRAGASARAAASARGAPAAATGTPPRRPASGCGAAAIRGAGAASGCCG